jgi:hypothetical protein
MEHLDCDASEIVLHPGELTPDLLHNYLKKFRDGKGLPEQPEHYYRRWLRARAKGDVEGMRQAAKDAGLL